MSCAIWTRVGINIPTKTTKEMFADSPIQQSGLSQSPYKLYDFSLFETTKGYRGGQIVDDMVLFTRDEYGNEICEAEHCDRVTLVIPERAVVPKNATILFSRVKAGHKIKSCLESKKSLRSETNPLTLHSSKHYKLFHRAVKEITRLQREYLEGINDPDLRDKVWWLVNACLYIDDFPTIPIEVFNEACMNFCLDYTGYSCGSTMKHPINYILETLGISEVVRQ